MNAVILSAQDISFGYRKGGPVLEHWSGEFESGEMVAITGESGRGKSTILYILGLMLAPRGGHVTLNGIDATSMSDRQRARIRATEYGFVFQSAELDASRTVLDNVMETILYSNADRRSGDRRARELLERFGVSLRADHKPGQVSGGQAQRVALCRALLNDPRVLLADEPTGNLDHSASSVVIEAMRQQADSGATVLVATHDPLLVNACDRKVQL